MPSTVGEKDNSSILSVSHGMVVETDDSMKTSVCTRDQRNGAVSDVSGRVLLSDIKDEIKLCNRSRSHVSGRKADT